MEQVKAKIEREKDVQFIRIEQDITPLQEKLIPLSQEKTKLLEQVKEIEAELTRDREWDISTDVVND